VLPQANNRAPDRRSIPSQCHASRISPKVTRGHRVRALVAVPQNPAHIAGIPRVLRSQLLRMHDVPTRDIADQRYITIPGMLTGLIRCYLV